MNDKLYIIILNWNGINDTLACLNSLNKVTFKNFEIVLIDNGSLKVEIDKLDSFCNTNYKSYSQYRYSKKDKLILEKSFFSDDLSIVLILNDENYGFAIGNNIGLQYVLNNGGKYAMLLNNDTIVEPNAISILYDCIIKCEFQAVVPQIRLYNPPNIIWNCGGSISKLGVRKYYFANEDIKNVPQSGVAEVDFVTGCALMMNIPKTGFLTERFFFGEEDFEFSIRLKKNKMKKACCYDSVIYHKVGASCDKDRNIKYGYICIHYSMRLSDIKSYYSPFYYKISVILHFIYSFYLLNKKRSITLKEHLCLWRDIIYNVKNVNIYTKRVYLTVINKQFNGESKVCCYKNLKMRIKSCFRK